MLENNRKKLLNLKDLDKIYKEKINEIIIKIKNNKNFKIIVNKIILSEIFLDFNKSYKNFNKEELTKLVNSINKYGLIDIIIVKKSNNGYYLVYGEKLSCAAKLAGLITISAIIIDFNYKKIKEIDFLKKIEIVNLNLIEEANVYKKLIDLLKITQKELSLRIKKSQSYISNVIRLLNLSTEIQILLLENKITIKQIKPLINLNINKIELKNIINKIINLNLNYKQIKDLILKYNLKPIKLCIKNNKKNSSKRIVNEFLENKIMKKLKTKVVIDIDKIIINYFGIKDLNRILEILGLIYK